MLNPSRPRRPGAPWLRGDLARRVVSTTLALFTVALALWWSPAAVVVLAVVVATALSIELHRLTSEVGRPPRLWLTVVVTVVVVASAAVDAVASVACLVGASLALAVTARPSRLSQLGVALLPVAWIGVPMACVVLLAASSSGRRLVVMTVVLIAVYESCAYLVGRRWGRRGITPRLSPRKTVAGLVAGCVGTIAVAVAGWLGCALDPTSTLVLTIGVCTLGFAGDLVASALKRAASVKDSGALIPGHGGLLDFADGFLFTIPAAYVLHLVHPVTGGVT